MSGVPDYPVDSTLDFKFSSRAFATGVPTTLAGTPAIVVYINNSTTEITAGITLTVDFDGKTGSNHLRIVATTANGYTDGSSFQAEISVGTVDSVSVVGEVVQQFSINRSPALRPTTVGRTLDVTSNGNAGIDWANIDNKTATVSFTATTINLVTTTTTSSDMRGTDGALLAASAPTNFSDMAITVTTGRVTVGTNNDKTGYSISGTLTTLDALNNFNPATDTVANVTLVATTTVNTDMLTTAAILASGDIDGLTIEQSMRIFGASLGGVLSGAGTTTITIKGFNGSTTTRILATVDANGNRSAVTLTVTA